MPLPSFVNSFASKAQAAVQQHIQQPGNGPRPASPDDTTQPSANQTAAHGAPPGQRSYTFETLGHQFRSLKEQYQTTSPVQKIVTTERGLALDFDAVSRDLKGQSKELYTWGQLENEDLNDVTDRLAYLNYIHGSISGSLAQKLNGARVPLKALRDAETSLQPRRTVRTGLQTQLSKIEHDQPKGGDKKIQELQAQIDKAQRDDAAQENEIEILKRKGLKESEQLKWDALREYGEKLVLLSQAATEVVKVIPAIPPTSQRPYQGAQVTAAARASLQRALDHYTTGSVKLDLSGVGADLSRHDTRSFGQSHSTELASIGTTAQSSVGQLTPPLEEKPLPHTHSTNAVPSQQSAGGTIDPHALNNAPATIPSHSGVQLQDTASPAPASPPIDASIAASDSNHPLASSTPVVAETGVPIFAGGSGPGPSSGSLLDLKNERRESAREDKHESAQEEKARLERQEVERAKKEMEGGPVPKANPKKDEEDLPPYQEM